METEKRLIDANALLYEYCQANGCNEVIDEICSNCFTAGLIVNAPTVDAVEVVRCVNCQSHEPCEVRNRVWCRTMGRYMKEDGFCSEGAKNDA